MEDGRSRLDLKNLAMHGDCQLRGTRVHGLQLLMEYVHENMKMEEALFCWLEQVQELLQAERRPLELMSMVKTK
jgi:hypothetical protein